MEVFLGLDIPPFVMYCANGKPRSSLFIESTDSMILFIFINVRMSGCNFVHSRDLGAQLWTIFDDELLV